MRSDRWLSVALASGERWALAELYRRLRAARDDAAFWSTLTGMLPRGVRPDEREGVTALRRHLDAPDLSEFVASAPIGLLVAFMLLAFVLGACNEPTTPDQHPPGAPSNAVTETATHASTTAAPATLPSATETAAPATTSAAETSAGPPDAGAKDVQTMTPDELRAALGEYIARADLPVSEKRRLERVLAEAPAPKVIGSREELARLFRENEPERIAVLLEQLVLFQRATPTPPSPRPVTRYKGVDFA